MTAAVWLGLAGLIVTPIWIAALSPYLPSRDVPYVASGFAGILCLGLFLVQPLLAGHYLPGLAPMQARRWHRRVGLGIVIAVFVHVGGLYLTSPPDTLDALFLNSPTPFSVFGVVAMWGTVFVALLAAARRRLGLDYSLWKVIHHGIGSIVIVSTVIHALQIEGTMGNLSKWVICCSLLLVTALVAVDLRLLRRSARAHDPQQS